MKAAVTLSGQFVIIGANHRSATLGLRDLLFVDDASLPAALQRLQTAGLNQALLLSTCDRTEILAVSTDPDRAARIAREYLAGLAGLSPDELSRRLYELTGEDAVRHCFAVAASLDSQIVGEPQVMAQVKQAYQAARAQAMLGPDLDSLMQGALAAAKRVRSETAIAEGPVSIAAAAIQVARDLHGDLARCNALVLGAGEMAELIGGQLRSAGVSRMTVSAPRASRAEALARSLDAQIWPFDDRAAALPQADVVLCAIGGASISLTAADLRQALRQRKHKPIFVIDAAIPGDVDSAVNDIEDAFLYDIGELENLAMRGKAGREQAALAGWEIIEKETTSFLLGRAERQAVPAIAALRRHFEEQRQIALAEARNDAEKATRLLIARLLHNPSQALRDLAALEESGKGDMQSAEELLRRLFGLKD